MTLTVGSLYTRSSLETILGISGLSATREGIITRNGSTILFVTLDKAQQANKDLHYNDFFQEDLFHWDSQTTQHSGTPSIQNIINGKVEVHLFARVHAKIKGKAQPFIYCGRLQYATHEPGTKNPVHIIYQSLDYDIHANIGLRALYEWTPKTPSNFAVPTNEIIKIPRNKSRGQGFGLTGPQRKAVELCAMVSARNALINLGATDILDVSINESRDYLAKINDQEWSIEVKGTTSSRGEEFFMSTNEKKLHENQQGQTGLIFVTGIILSGTPEQPVASGGLAEVYLPWQINDWTFEPLTYKVSRKN